MIPEQLTERMKSICGSNLKAVILYGSAVAGDHAGRRSDYNVLVVLDRLGVTELNALSSVTRRWVNAGNPAPRLFTPQGLAGSVDLFPLEIADLQENHKVLFGQDLVKDFPLHQKNLRLQLEHELNGKLIQLRQHYLLAQGNPRQVTELLIRSLSTFLVLFRGALRLYQPKVPAQKMEALRELAKRMALPTRAFESIEQLKKGKQVPGLDSGKLFTEYLQAIETVVNAVDKLGRD